MLTPAIALPNGRVLVSGFDPVAGSEPFVYIPAGSQPPTLTAFTNQVIQAGGSVSVGFTVADPDIVALPRTGQAALIKDLTARLETERVAYDIAGHRDAPPGLRLWGGATVERADL